MGSQPTHSTQVQSTSNQSKSEPHPYVQGDLQRQLDRMRAWEAANPTAPLYQVANPSPAQRAARDAAWRWGVDSLDNQASAFNPALGYLSDAATGKFLDRGDAAMAGKLDAMFRPQNEQFVNLVAPSLNATFAGAGRTGGGLHVDNMLERYKSDIARTQADAAARTAADVYGMERGLQSSAATALPGVVGQMGSQAQAWLDMLRAIGAGDTAAAQRRRDGEKKNFHAQPHLLTGMAQRYLGMFPGGQTLGSGTTTGWSTAGGGGGGFDSIAGPIMSGIGRVLPLLFGSDRRMKTDIEELGVDRRSGLPMYAYRYRGDPKSYPKVVGPMAQDIEERGGPVRQIAGRKVIAMGGLI